MHWLNWDQLKMSKFEGGMRFQDLKAFNATMLAKQLWRVLSRPHTLVHPKRKIFQK